MPQLQISHMKIYTVDMLGNVVGSRPVRYLNVPMDRLKELAIAQMKAGETVWFGSDVGQVELNRKAGNPGNRCLRF